MFSWFGVPPEPQVAWRKFRSVANLYDNSGETLSIKASGDFKEKVEEGAKVHIQVKYGLITLINQQNDLCDAISNVDLECPLDKGEMSLTKDVSLPKQIPPVCISGNCEQRTS